MDNLEHYLDQVCRGIGGPRSLRQHVRQELREHLRDAVAEHRRAGLSEEEALARALKDFGKPEQVRSELEATHGHRLMAVVIDKAMQWKERTMKAKWLWTTWAHLVLVGVNALEVGFISFTGVYLVPKFRKFIQEGWISDYHHEPLVSWIPSYLHGLDWVGHYAFWMIILFAAAWGLFEWRVRSDCKSLMRLSILGTSALGLMVAVSMTAWAMVIPFMLEVPSMHTRNPEPIVSAKVENIETSVKALDEAMATKDWEAIQGQTTQVASAVNALAQMGAAAPTLVSLRDQAKVDELRAQLKLASDYLREAQDAGLRKNMDLLAFALEKFRKAYAPVKDAVK